MKRPEFGPEGYITHAVSRVSPTLKSGGQNKKRPNLGLGGYITHAITGVPQHLKMEDEMKRGANVGLFVALPMPSRGSPTLHDCTKH